MVPISLKEICEGLKIPCEEDREILNISTDTRKIKPGSLFVALVGEQFDGHDYVQKAFENGAVAAVVQRAVVTDGLLLQVESTETAFQTIAGIYRDKFQINVVGLTGSIGKTTTREMVYAVLNGFEKTLKTQNNLNNQFGTPQTLLGLDNSYKNAVIEMGMSGFGEIEALSLCVKPTLALITNIGVSHIEHLGSREGIFQAKLEIVKGLKPGGKLLLCADDDLLYNNKDSLGVPTLTYGISNAMADAVGRDIFQTKEGARFTIDYKGSAYKAQIPIPGEHNVLNAVGAFLVGVTLGYEPQKCAEHLMDYKTSGMRQHIVKHGEFTVIEDCYNAGPDSMKSALKLLRTVAEKGRTIAVLGDMLELGDITQEMHRLVGRYVGDNHVDILFATGDNARFIVEEAKACGVKEVKFFKDRNELNKELKKTAKQGDTLLFKASRGLKFEELISEFYGG